MKQPVADGRGYPAQAGDLQPQDGTVFYEKEGLLRRFESISSRETVEAIKKVLGKGGN